MLYFRTRTAARNFARKTGRKFIDNGIKAIRRWAVKL